eukprot:10255451-Karenia_brevis.AAC.1
MQNTRPDGSVVMTVCRDSAPVSRPARHEVRDRGGGRSSLLAKHCRSHTQPPVRAPAQRALAKRRQASTTDEIRS